MPSRRQAKAIGVSSLPQGARSNAGWQVLVSAKDACINESGDRLANPCAAIQEPSTSDAEMAKLLAARRGDGVRIEGVSDPADPDHDLYLNGGLLPSPHATLAGPTFEAWLRER